MVRATWIVISIVILAGPTGTSAARVAINDLRAAVTGAINDSRQRAKRGQKSTILDAPKLCDTSIVEEVCLDLSDNGFFIKEEFQDRVTASDDSVDDFWNELNLPDRPTCLDSCKAIVEYVKKVGVLPPASDVACYTVDGVVHCDRYVGPDVLPTFGPQGDLPATLLEENESSSVPVTDTKKMPEEDTIVEDEDEDVDEDFDYDYVDVDIQPLFSDYEYHPGGLPPSDELSPDLSLASTTIEYDTWDLIKRAAMFFRIFPESKPDKESSLAEVAMTNLTRANWPPGGERATKQAQADARAFVMHTIAAIEDKRTKRQISRWFGSSSSSDPARRNKIKSTLNSVLNMIDKVFFVPIGRECSANTYAYVYPRAMPKCKISETRYYPCTRMVHNMKSYFVFYLCPFYYSKPREMVETLVHEGSHHASAYLDDVKYQGATAYGRGRCQTLARGRPLGALNNADNFCYYVQDVAVEVKATSGSEEKTPVQTVPPVVDPIIVKPVVEPPVTGGDDPSGDVPLTCMRSGPTGMHVKKIKPDRLGNCHCKYGSLSCYEGDADNCPAWEWDKYKKRMVVMRKANRYRADCYTCSCKYA